MCSACTTTAVNNNFSALNMLGLEYDNAIFWGTPRKHVGFQAIAMGAIVGSVSQELRVATTELESIRKDSLAHKTAADRWVGGWVGGYLKEGTVVTRDNSGGVYRGKLVCWNLELAKE